MPDDSATMSRRAARRHVCEILYGADVAPGSMDDDVADAYAAQLLGVIHADAAAIDAAIAAHLREDWPLSRLGAVERSVLRIATAEILHDELDVPVEVAIDQAVVLAKRYADERAARLINGVLGSLARAAAAGTTEEE